VLGRVKQLMNESFDSSLAAQLERERQAIAVSANSKEGREGVVRRARRGVSVQGWG